MSNESYNKAMCVNPHGTSINTPSEDRMNKEVVSLRTKLQELEKENESLKKENKDLLLAIKQPEEDNGNQENMQDAYSTKEESNVDAENISEPLTAETIAEVAQSALAQTGWVYDKTTDTYFDYNTKLYYYPASTISKIYVKSFKNVNHRKRQSGKKNRCCQDSMCCFISHAIFFSESIINLYFQSTQLYYNYSNGCYYRYNQKSKQYDFHHQHKMFKQKTNSCDVSTQTLDSDQNQESEESKVKCSRAAVARMTARTGQTSSLSDNETECIKSYQKQIKYDETTLTQSSRNRSGKRSNAPDKELGFQLCPKKKYVICFKCGKYMGTDFSHISNQNVVVQIFPKDLQSTRVNQSEIENNADAKIQSDQFNATCSSGFVKYGKITQTKQLREDEISDVESFMKYSMVANQEQDGNESQMPCIRAMVSASEILETGALYIIPCTGATIGTSEQCDINIVEEGIDNEHAKIFYHTEQKNYFAADLGSSTGTCLDSAILNKPRQKSIFPTPIHHKSILSIGTTTLELHIHPGYDTCDDCEPGQVSSLTKHRSVQTNPPESKEMKWRSELKGLKKKYGLHKDKYRNPKPLGSQYIDRAVKRRQTKGSDNPYEKDEFPTSVNIEISESNKGCQMLKQMGWKEGKGLGKSEEGITEPIQARGTAGTKFGLGFSNQGAR